jgi:hypothetical protein
VAIRVARATCPGVLARAGRRPPASVRDRVLVEPGVEDREQDAPDDLVQAFGRDGAGGEVLGRPSLGDREPGDVEPGVGGGHRVTHGVPEVGGHESLPAPLVLEHAQDVRVLAGVDAVEPVVGAHHRPGAAALDHRLERRVVQLLERPLADHGVDGRRAAAAGGIAGAPGLGVVPDEVLDHRNDVAVLDGPDLGGGQPAGQTGVLPQRLGQAAAQRRPGDVDRRAEQHVRAGVAGLLRDRGPVLGGQALVEGRGQGQGGRERGHVARPADAVGAVGVPQGRDAEMGHRLEVVDGQGDLLLGGHLGQQPVGALACRTQCG